MQFGLFLLFRTIFIVSLLYSVLHLMDKKKQTHYKWLIRVCQTLIIINFFLFLAPFILLLSSKKNGEMFFCHSFDVLHSTSRLMCRKEFGILVVFLLLMIFLLFPIFVVVIFDMKKKTNTNIFRFVFGWSMTILLLQLVILH